MKKFLKDMDYEEILLLVKNNPAFAGKVSERTESDFWYWVNDEYFRDICFNYTAGGYYGPTFEFSRGEPDTDIADHLKKIQKNYCFFSEEEYNEVVSRFIELAERYDQIYYDLSDDDERLGSRVAELRKQVEGMISNILDADYESCFEAETLADCVCTYDDFDDYYTEDGGHQVYREVHYIEEIA